MEEAKYYTPSIEEFHVGFEYERCDHGGDWFKDVFPRTWENGQGVGWDALLTNAIAGQFIRVKYLDRQDIESEGWKMVGNENPAFTVFNRGDYWLDFHGQGYMEITGGVDTESEELNCQITIRNISEFRKLLKQIGIK